MQCVRGTIDIMASESQIKRRNKTKENGENKSSAAMSTHLPKSVILGIGRRIRNWEVRCFFVIWKKISPFWISQPAPPLYIQMTASSDELKKLGNASFQSNDFPQAIEHFTNAIALDESNHVLYSNRSAAYSSLKDYKSVYLSPE